MMLASDVLLGHAVLGPQRAPGPIPFPSTWRDQRSRRNFVNRCMDNGIVPQFCTVTLNDSSSPQRRVQVVFFLLFFAMVSFHTVLLVPLHQPEELPISAVASWAH